MFGYFVPYMLPVQQAETITETYPTASGNYDPELVAVRPLAEGVGPSSCRSERIDVARPPIRRAPPMLPRRRARPHHDLRPP